MDSHSVGVITGPKADYNLDQQLWMSTTTTDCNYDFFSKGNHSIGITLKQATLVKYVQTFLHFRFLIRNRDGIFEGREKRPCSGYAERNVTGKDATVLWKKVKHRRIP